MSGTPYPKQPMYRFAYTRLSKEQIAAKLEPVAQRGPKNVSPLATDFAGSSLTLITDDGPRLSYKFASNTRLSVAENGGKAVNAGFGALEMDNFCLFSHMIPGTQRGYTVVIDRKSKLATVIEVWFSGYEDNREVQRQPYYGYIDAGGPAPKERHQVTNRVEGRGYHWRQDNGMETLEYYPSSAYSHFVELSRTGGELGYSAPSDYIKLDDDFYLYTRTECELSGTFTAYVIDMNRSQQMGIRLGFDEGDELHYDIFRGHGDIVGQIAHFEKFEDNTGDPVPGPKDKDGKPVKGGRRVYRPIKTLEKLNREQVDQIVKEHSTAFPVRTTTGGAAGMSANALPASDFLAGKTFTLRKDDGNVAGLRWWMPGVVRTIADNMLTTDEPDHTRLRSIVDEVFRRRAVLEMQPRIMALAQARGASATTRLCMAVPSHCPLLETQAQELETAAMKAGLHAPRLMYISGSRARALLRADLIVHDLAWNMARPVLWHDTLRHAFERGARLAVEVPGGGALTRLAHGVFAQDAALDAVAVLEAVRVRMQRIRRDSLA